MVLVSSGETKPSVGAIVWKAVAWLAVVTVPLFGTWLASSLAAYGHHGPWKSALVGLVLFPVAPGVWELASTLRSGKKRWLTLRDRLVLRTLTVSALFLVALLVLFPKKAFSALATRGDWMFDGSTSALAENGRAATRTAAHGLEWLYLATRDTPFDSSDIAPDANELVRTASTASTSTTAPLPSALAAPSGSASAIAQTTVAPAPTVTPTPTVTDSRFTWPSEAKLSPTVTTMPPEAETSPEAVGSYIAAHEPTQLGRVRAAHDWVADHIAYDGPSYRAGRYPPQDAATVFAKRVGVCAGYAHVFQAIAKSAGLEARYVVGTVRGLDMRPDGESHAWNAVKIDGAWALLDTTWDAGHLEGEAFVKRYSTVYFLTPPDVFRVDHFPDQAEWQLDPKPLDRVEFFRRPMMTAEFFSDGFVLESPDRSQVSTEGEFRVSITNPKNRYVLVQDGKKNCRVERASGHVAATCPVVGKGLHRVELFASPVEFGSYHYVGSFEVNRL